MATTNTGNMPGGTITINSNSITAGTIFKPEPGLAITDEDGFSRNVLDTVKLAEDLELRIEAMTEHLDEITEETGYRPSMTMEERIEAKRFLKKLSGK